MKANGRRKQWGQMSAAGLAAATREFDRPLPASRYKRPTKADRARFERARRASKLSTMRGEARLIASLRLDSSLLRIAASYAKRKKLTWSQLLERGLRRELAVKD